MNENKGLLSSGLGMVGRNKRYIFWFYVLNAALARFGTAAFGNQAHAILDHSLHADGLLHGFSIGVLTELFARPEFGSNDALTAPALNFALLFFVQPCSLCLECCRATLRRTGCREKIFSALAGETCGGLSG